MDKLKIAVLFGGYSEEHDISIKSAMEIKDSMDKSKYEPIFIGISKNGEWRLCYKPEEKWESNSCVPAIISPNRKDHGIIVFENGSYSSIYIDAVFPVIHGKMGEDGQIQGLLDMSGIPYVGCGIQASILGMDKSLTHLAVRNAGVSTPDYYILNEGENVNADSFSYPVFVKPARSGSSFGVSKVSYREELAEAIEKARVYDKKILIEEAILGNEVGCAVLGSGDELIVGEVDMITLSHGFFRIHQEEKPEGGSENSNVTVPAHIPFQVCERIKETAKTVYKALGCEGLARVDMFLKDDGSIVVNEVNTMPGCTSYSRYPRMMAASGITMSKVIDKVIEIAMKCKLY